MVLCVVRREPRHQLVKQGPKGVVIDAKRVASAQDHLRGHVLGRPAVGEGLASRIYLLGKAEVDDLAVTVGINQDILRFQVSVNDRFGVQVLNAVKDLQEVKLSHFLAHHLHLLEQVEELSAWTI
jgi:hypothetical protein